ncbi:hypothetical protein ACJX0J_032715, partial [Zea mays]
MYVFLRDCIATLTLYIHINPAGALQAQGVDINLLDCRLLLDTSILIGKFFTLALPEVNLCIYPLSSQIILIGDCKCKHV